MPSCEKCIATPPPPPIPPTAPPIPPEQEPRPPAVPPVIVADLWEDFPAWRETFLLFFTDPAANETLRRLGVLLHEFVLEFCRFWPEYPEGLTRAELRAAVADLRHLQGFLAEAGRKVEGGLSADDARLCRVALRVADQLAAIVDQVERELGSWRGEEGA